MSEDDDSNLDSEWWWIDYLEDEMDPKLESDLRTLLQHSQEDRDSFERFRLLRAWLRDSDPIGEWPLDERIARLHGKVMSFIEQEVLVAPVERPGDYAPLMDATKVLRV